MKTTHQWKFAAAALAGGLWVCLAGCAATTTESTTAPAPHVLTTVPVSPAEAVRRLADGNTRFVSGHSLHPHQDPSQRAAVAMNQSPFAVILGCSDSRTGPEILFDQGLGDLFVVRTAGNVVDDHAIGSIEYAVEHLRTRLVVVMGHQRCGAISAARETLAGGGHADGHIDSLVTAIRPAVEQTAGQDVEATCKANVRNVVQTLRRSEPILRHMVDGDEVRVIGAYYDLDTGRVIFIKD